jgi:type I restriction enzyme R subunit
MPIPEDEARENIDRLLIKAGWTVSNQSETNILAHRGLNFTLKSGQVRFADYLLYVDGGAAA